MGISHRHETTVLLSIVLVAQSMACDAPNRDGYQPSITTRDSVGVQIVEHDVNVLGQLPAWHIAATPSMRIGSDDGAEPYLFSRITAATRFSTGDIVVFDGSSQELRYFTEQGQFIRKSGRTGSGPGEYRLVYSVLRLPGDTLLLFDQVGGRLTWLAPNSEVVALEPHRGPRIFHEGLLLPDGSRLVPIFPPRAEPDGPGLWRPTGYLVRVDHATAIQDTLGTFRGAEQVWQGVLVSPPAARSTLFASTGGQGFFAIADTEQFDIRLMAIDGHELVHIRRRGKPLDAPASYMQSWRDRMITRAAGRLDAAQARRAVASVGDVVTLPAFEGLNIAEDGDIWIEEFRTDPNAVRAVTVFDRNGHPKATATFPVGLRVVEIGTRYVLGVSTDSLGVQTVAIHALER